MSVALYNPRTIDRGGEKIENTANIERFVWSHANWVLKVDEMRKFPDDVGEAMLRTYEFLVRVTKENLEEIKKIRSEKKYSCKYCEFKTNAKSAFIAHAKSHKEYGTDKEYLDTIEEATPTGDYNRPQSGSVIMGSPEAKSDVPPGGTKYQTVPDGDNVGWYGDGVEVDTNT